MTKTGTCRECGKVEEGWWGNRQFCDACRGRLGREYAARKRREWYARDPKSAKAQAKVWRLANPERRRQYTLNSYGHTCVQCGGMTLVSNDVPREGYLCRPCKTENRRSWAWRQTCYYCEYDFWRKAYSGGRSIIKQACPTCRGLYAATARTLNLTSERVRQLVEREMKRHPGLTHRKAALKIIQERTSS